MTQNAKTPGGVIALGGKWFVGSPGEAITLATTPVTQALLQNEAWALKRLNGCCAPRLISLTEEPAGLRMIRSFIPGKTLDQVERSAWASLITEFKEALGLVHQAGLIHGDLRASNLVVTGQGLVAIDWEHAMPIGADLATYPHRAVSLGTAAPDMIWARGQAKAALDLYALDRLYDEATHARTAT